MPSAVGIAGYQAVLFPCEGAELGERQVPSQPSGALPMTGLLCENVPRMVQRHVDRERTLLGILEAREDPFVQDLASRLGTVEFLSFGEESVATSREFRVIIDRASYCYPYLREMLKACALDGCYVLNNPFAASTTNKLIDLRVCHRLHIPVPKTLVLPDLNVRQEFVGLVREPFWERLCNELGFPCVMKPFDGYGWTDVYVVNDLKELRELYTKMGSGRIFLVQQLIEYSHYYRVFSVGHGEVFFTQWIPKPLGAGEYSLPDPKPLESVKDRLTRMTVELNAYLDLDLNVLEWCLDEEGRPWLIDAFNDVPDIRKQCLPAECYQWLVDRVVACVQEKLRNPAKRNRVPFDLSVPVRQEEAQSNLYYDILLRQANLQ